MALVLKDRVKETTATTGTGSYVLAGAVTGFQSFTSALADGDTTYYAVENGTDWETGLGTWTESTTTLARTTVYESSNSGNAVNWGSGTKDVFITQPASRVGNMPVYATPALLPSSGNQDGDIAFVLSTNSVFVSKTNGWYRIATVNNSPTFTTSPSASYYLATDGTATVITLAASDPEGENLTWTYTATGASGIATISNADNVYTITPATSGNGGQFTVVFSVSDSVNTANTSSVRFSLSFLSTNWKYAALSQSASASAYNLTNAVDTGTNISLSTNNVHFTNSGNSAVAVTSSTTVASYSLSTAYDLSTAGSGSTYTQSEEATMEDVRLSADGSKMYIVGLTNDTVYQYSLSTAYDVSTASYDSVSFAIGGQEAAPRSMAFKSDGTKMYIMGNSGDDINEYDLSTAWNISTASYSTNFATYQGTPLNIEFSNDGTRVFVYGSSTLGTHPDGGGSGRITIDRYDLSTAWDISTASYHSVLVLSSAINQMTFNNTGTTLYVGTDVYDMGRSTNSEFIDRSTNAYTVTPTGTPIQTAFNPYLGNWSVEFDGTNDYFYTPSSADFQYGTGDFTWEVWVWIDQSVDNDYILDHGNNGGTLVIKNTTAKYYNVTTGLNSSLYATGGNLTLGKWNHVAASRSSGTTRFFVDGVLTTSGSDTHNYGAQAVTIGKYGSGTSNFIGRLSNLRLVKGTALYTSSFTPSTTRLTAVTGTSLLACQSNRFIDNSGNDHDFTVGGNPKISAFNPVGQESAYTTGENKGSVYFESASQYLFAPTGELALGSGDFTIELWIYLNSYNASTSSIVDFRSAGGASTNVPAIFLSATGVPSWAEDVGSANNITSTTAIKLNQWAHLAVVRNGSTITMYLNGTSVGSYTGSSTFGVQRFRINDSQGSYSTAGYFSDFKMCIGTAVYTSTFTPPTTPVGNANADLYLPFDNAGIYDQTGDNTIYLGGNTKTSTAQTKFANASIYFDGTGDTAYIEGGASQKFNIGLQTKWTVEFWANTVAATGQRLLTFVGPQSIGIVRASSGSNTTVQLNHFGVAARITSAADTYPANTWTHVALVRDGSQINLYVNGIYEGNTTTMPSSGAYEIWIGSSPSPYANSSTNGYIENVQFLSGIAKYSGTSTGTANFTVPTQEQNSSYQAAS